MQNTITAVTFDADGFAAWLDAPSTAGSAAPINRDANSLLGTAYQRNDGTAGWLVETTLDALRHSPEPGIPVWAYGLGVSDVRVWTTCSAEDGPDGGITGEVTVDGVILSLGHLGEGDLVPADAEVLPGYEAAAHALSAVAGQVNAIAEAFRTNRAPYWTFGDMNTADIETALFTLAEYVAQASAPDLSERQMEVALQVQRIVQGLNEVVDAEIVE